MVRQLVRQTDEITRELTLDDGSAFNLDSIVGTDWTRDRLDRLTAALQAEADTVIALADLPDGDPDKTATARELHDQYGGRVFLDGQGNIVHRNVEIWFTFENDVLVPHHKRVR